MIKMTRNKTIFFLFRIHRNDSFNIGKWGMNSVFAIFVVVVVEIICNIYTK
jgi:hypothetical protein